MYSGASGDNILCQRIRIHARWYAALDISKFATIADVADVTEEWTDDNVRNAMQRPNMIRD